MIVFEDLLVRFKELDRRELGRWIDNGWILPERRDQTWVFQDRKSTRLNSSH